MAKVLFLLVASLALASCRVRRDAPEQSPLATIEKHATELQKAISEQFGSLANSKNTQQVNKALREGSDSVLQQLSALSSSLQSAFADANEKTKAAVEQTRAQLQRSADELRRAHPEVEQQAGALKDKLQQALQTSVQETQKLAKEVAANVEQTGKQLEPKLKSAYDDFAKQIEQIQKNIHDAATKQ